ncbi:hypothetical protein I7I50_07014 [Histoplasma capsulatum G186AR]|uniref:Uncharacterized protein n=1 Tax=Ajellomyces capsulatus TaxID=5037 RepID=A0A8H8D3I8_AJECA|nr:hypothetical protein I7I52_09912 [Histoplasma capsulatum]QSS67823.1 hypothetical protein I7I50_07014 [Histoplasma capsulatum G186AR]
MPPTVNADITTFSPPVRSTWKVLVRNGWSGNFLLRTSNVIWNGLLAPEGDKSRVALRTGSALFEGAAMAALRGKSRAMHMVRGEVTSIVSCEEMDN